MNKGITIIKRIIGIIFIIFVCSLMLLILSHLTRPVDPDSSIKAINTFHDMPDNTFEVMVYGSSHAWKGVDSIHMYNEYGIGCYNYAGNWQRINTTKLFIEDSLCTQTPKILLIETFRVNEILQDVDLNGEIYYTKAIDNTEYKKSYLEQCFGDDKERYLSYYFPFYMFHGNWNKLTQDSFMDNSSERNFYQSMGFAGSDKVEEIELYDYTEFEQKELSEDSLEILDDIVAMCEEKNIDIIFFTVPYEGEYKFISAMENYAAENGCVYLNLFAEIETMKIDVNTDFQDGGHLNAYGAQKIADFLGQYIIDNYNVTDVRGGNNIWTRYCE